MPEDAGLGQSARAVGQGGYLGQPLVAEARVCAENCVRHLISAFATS
jgi:hypothetical protein